MAAAETSDRPFLPQCCSEGNEEQGASQLVVVPYKVVELRDEREELVTGKQNFIPLHFLDSKRQGSIAK